MRHEAVYCASIHLSHFTPLSFPVVSLPPPLLAFSEIFLPSRRASMRPKKRHQPGSRSCGAFITPSIIHSTHQPRRSGTDLGSGSTRSSSSGSGPADWQRGCSGICRAQQNAHCSRNSSVSFYSSTRLKGRDSPTTQSVCFTLRIFLGY